METRLLNDVGRRESGDDFRVQWWYGCMVVVVSMEHGRRNKDVCVVVLCIRHVMSTQTPGFPPILLCSPPKSIFFPLLGQRGFWRVRVGCLNFLSPCIPVFRLRWNTWILWCWTTGTSYTVDFSVLVDHSIDMSKCLAVVVESPFLLLTTGMELS